MKIAIIGAGSMGASIARALYRIAPQEGLVITLTNPSTPKLEAVKADCPDINVTTDNTEAVIDADVVILAVKPWILPAVIEQIKPRLVYRRHTIVSIAGGVSLDDLDKMLTRGDELPAAFYVIPDTAISVGEGMTFIASRRASETLVETIRSLFASMGDAAVVEERLMAAGTALCSCGIAYVYKYIQASMQAGVQLGFRPADALRYVEATVAGAVAMLRANNTLPQEEIDKVTTPGGMTIKGINELEHAGFTSAVIRGTLAPVK